MSGQDDEPADPYGLGPDARISVGGYFPSTSAPVADPPVPDEVMQEVLRSLALLEQTYPAWRFWRLTASNGTPGGWKAVRRIPLTHAQRVAGLISIIERGDVPGLVMALAVQDEIAHQTGYA
ncbi:hypothetical protein [Sphaerisporangium rhizosphaerae]|uniref:Uncharacterized protein n=1 Tax=Sphaerisporangium rhizosphaerae TaxID=2269375 RepID=A0ABW2P274_9ACTN